MRKFKYSEVEERDMITKLLSENPDVFFTFKTGEREYRKWIAAYAFKKCLLSGKNEGGLTLRAGDVDFFQNDSLRHALEKSKKDGTYSDFELSLREKYGEDIYP